MCTENNEEKATMKYIRQYVSTDHEGGGGTEIITTADHLGDAARPGVTGRQRAGEHPVPLRARANERVARDVHIVRTRSDRPRRAKHRSVVATSPKSEPLVLNLQPAVHTLSHTPPLRHAR